MKCSASVPKRSALTTFGNSSPFRIKVWRRPGSMAQEMWKQSLLQRMLRGRGGEAGLVAPLSRADDSVVTRSTYGLPPSSTRI